MLPSVFCQITNTSRLAEIYQQCSSLPLSLYYRQGINIFCGLRFKHSKRQIKRLFKKHPAFHRVAGRNDTLFKYLTPEKPIFKPQFPVKCLPNGWYFSSQSKEAEKFKQSLPFHVHRTSRKPNGAIGFLPVYSDSRNSGSKKSTIIRKVTGDMDIFIRELKAILGFPPNCEKCIKLRASKTVLEVNGNRSREIKTWLAGLGF